MHYIRNHPKCAVIYKPSVMELSFLPFRGAFRFLQKRFVICDDIVLVDIFIIDPLSSKISKSGHTNAIC